MKLNKKIIKELVTLNKNIFKNNLTILNFGNASYLDRANQAIYIKGTGFNTKDVSSEKISILRIKNNKFYPVNKVKPSVDTIIHYSIYRALPKIKFKYVTSLYMIIGILSSKNLESFTRTFSGSFF